MRSSRFKLGLIWLGVWLLVALVPPWRMRALRQLTNPSASALLRSGANGFGLSPELEREAARRFPTDVGAQLAPLHGVQSQDLSAGPPPGQPYPVNRFDADQEANQATMRRRAIPYFRCYDELERRFPDSNAVRAQRLRDTMRGNMIGNQGPFAKRDLVLAKLLHAPVWLGKPELQSALRAALAGARREPDDGFYPWMQAVLQFSLERPDAALRALDAAGKCSRWSDDTGATVARRIALLKRLRGADWQDEDWETWAALLPHLAQMRSVARATTGQLRLARRRGDEARALQIAGILERAGANLSRGKDTLIGGLVGQAVCQIAWAAVVEDVPGVLKPTPSGVSTKEEQRALLLENRARRLNAFITYARAHGRSDLAQEAAHINASFDADELSEHFFQSGLGVDAVSRSAGQLSGAFVLGAALMWLSLAGALAWFVGWLVTLRHGGAQIGRAQTLAAACFCLGATGALLGFWVSQNGASSSFIYEFYGGEPPEPSPLAWLPSPFAWLANLVPFALPLLWLAPALLGVALRHVPRAKLRLRHPDGALDWKRITSLMLGSFLVGGLAVLYLSQAPRSALADQILLYVALVWCLCVIAAHVLFFLWAPRDKRLGRIFGIGALWTGLTALGLFLSSTENAAYAFGVALLALGMLALSLFFTRHQRGTSRGGAGAWLFDFALHARLTAGVLALGATFGYLGVSLWTIPVEARAGREVRRQLQIGEPAYLREQLQLHP